MNIVFTFSADITNGNLKWKGRIYLLFYIFFYDHVLSKREEELCYKFGLFRKLESRYCISVLFLFACFVF